MGWISIGFFTRLGDEQFAGEFTCYHYEEKVGEGIVIAAILNLIRISQRQSQYIDIHLGRELTDLWALSY